VKKKGLSREGQKRNVLGFFKNLNIVGLGSGSFIGAEDRTLSLIISVGKGDTGGGQVGVLP